MQPINESNKEYLPAVLLSYTVGNLGIDRFYLGYTGKGIAKLLTLGGFGVWTIVDIIRIAYGKTTDRYGRPLRGYWRYNRVIKLITLLLVIIPSCLVIPGIIAALVLTTHSGINERARNVERQTDLKTISSSLEQYYSENVQYPTLDQLNDSSFRAGNLPQISIEAMKDPKGMTSILTADHQQWQYQYQPAPEGCTNEDVICTSFVLTAEQEGADAYSVKSQSE